MAEGAIIFRGDFGYGVVDGTFQADSGESIPVKIVKVIDATMTVEVIMPVESAHELAQKLLGTAVQVVPASALNGLNGQG